LDGSSIRYSITVEGELLEDIERTFKDHKLTINIPKRTTVLDAKGRLITNIKITTDEAPPVLPEGFHIIGLAYKFEPSGITFDPEMILTYAYDPSEIPGDIAEENLFFAYHDEEAGEWVELPSTVDLENNTVTASVPHFTSFAVIGPVKPPAFILSSLAISPTVVTPDEKVNISLSVANTGGKSGSYPVTLKINRLKEAEKSITVEAGSSETVTFSVTRSELGRYTVDVDGLRASFTVVAPAAFSTANLAITPAQIRPGEAVTVSVLVTNTGEVEGSHTVVLKINDVKELEKSITIEAGGSKVVTFSVTRSEPGIYIVDVDGLRASFTVGYIVRVGAPAVFSMTNLAVKPAQVEPGEAVTVSVLVANTGEAEGSHTVVLRINGLKETDKSITLEAGSSETVTFSVTRSELGRYTVDVDGMRTSFIVGIPSARPPAEEVNWLAIIVIISASVIAVMGLIYFLLHKR